jgi:7-cyano-7-deazaguanine synthase in queuosine biosynthesis
VIKVVMFSGGLDSTALLFKTLKEDCDVHVHHIRLINREKRDKAEDRAVSKLIKEARKIKPFVFSSNTYECPDSCGIGYTGFDIIKVGFIAGDVVNMILSAIKMNTPEQQEIEALVGINKSEVGNCDYFNDIRYLATNQAFDCHFLTQPNKPKLSWPFLDLIKSDIVGYIPKPLIKYINSCRRPVEVGSEFIPCGLCAACRRLNNIKL